MPKTLSAKYYQENKEIIQKKAHKRYQNLSKEEKQKKQQYGRERYKNRSEDEKQKFGVKGAGLDLRKYEKSFLLRKYKNFFDIVILF